MFAKAAYSRILKFLKLYCAITSCRSNNLFKILTVCEMSNRCIAFRFNYNITFFT